MAMSSSNTLMVNAGVSIKCHKSDLKAEMEEVTMMQFTGSHVHSSICVPLQSASMFRNPRQDLPTHYYTLVFINPRLGLQILFDI